MEGLVIDPQARARASSAEVVDADPSADLIVGPVVAIRPIVELFIHPCEESHGAVGERVGEGLRLGGLLGAVAGAFFEEPVGAGEAGLVAGGVGG